MEQVGIAALRVAKRKEFVRADVQSFLTTAVPRPWSVAFCAQSLALCWRDFLEMVRADVRPPFGLFMPTRGRWIDVARAAGGTDWARGLDTGGTLVHFR